MERFARPDTSGGQQEGATAELIEAVGELISLMGKGGISELDLTSGDISIRLRGGTAGQALAAIASVDSAPLAAAVALPIGHEITAPMIGTYYSAPAPGEAPFIQIGDEVEVGQVVGIIEAMKIMNEIVADRPGVVTDILVENAQAVEYGSPILRLTDQTDVA